VCSLEDRERARLCYKWRECSVRLNEVCTLRQFTCIVNYQRMWTTRDHFTYPLQRGTEGRHGVVLRSNHQRVRYDPSQEEEAYCSNKSLPYHIRPLVIDQAVCNWVRCKSQGHKRTAQHDSKECQNRIPTSSAHQPERTAAQRRCQLPAPMRDGAQRQGCLFGLHVCLGRHRGAFFSLIMRLWKVPKDDDDVRRLFAAGRKPKRRRATTEISQFWSSFCVARE
jgi:hypothetical protein